MQPAAPGVHGVAAPHALPCQAVAAQLGTDIEHGLTAVEAQRRLTIAGRNELAAVPVVPAWRRFRAQFESPLVLLLIAATAISFAVWIIEARPLLHTRR